MTITLQKGIRFLSGKVKKGKQLGRKIGFPTANLEVPLESLPPHGVYGVYVYRGNQQYLGIMNVGKRPTIQDENHETIEVYILKFNESIYDETLVIEILFRIRNERKFSNLKELSKQLKKDVEFTKKAIHEIQKLSIAL